MEELIWYVVIGVGAGVVCGASVAWVLRGSGANREIQIAEENWKREVERAESKAQIATSQTATLKVNLAQTQKLLLENKHAAVSSCTELESAREKVQSLSGELSEARAERDEYVRKYNDGQQYVLAAKRQIDGLTEEFEKSRKFYKGQIGNAIERRQALEQEVDQLTSEKESLATLLTSAKAEQDSVSRMLESAKSRLAKLDAIEQKNIELEADNAELRHHLETTRHSVTKLEKQIADFEDIKAQNRELANCLESMEQSRRQYEADARRYRDQYELSEKKSETLRMKLGDIEQSLNEMEAAREQADNVARIPQIGMQPPPDGEGDDLKEIVGIGKVFEAMLHDLGIYYFRQIATFGPDELARVNEELKEFKGRIEHDDWMGQARELHFKKYGGSRTLADAG